MDLEEASTIYGPIIWSRIANGPDKQIGPFHNQFLIKLALVFFSKLKVPFIEPSILTDVREHDKHYNKWQGHSLSQNVTGVPDRNAP